MEENFGTNVTSDEDFESAGIPKIPPEILENARNQCTTVHANTSLSDLNEGSYCPRVFDGWACWNDTPAGHVAYTSCPSFVTGFDSKRQGFRICLENGTWFTHPHTNEPWSNYSNCVDLSNLERHLAVNRVYIAGYSISLASLAISLFIFFFFRSLNCKRVTIHKNLFASFIVNNFLWLIWHLAVVESTHVISTNGIGCQVLHVLLHYFLVSNYFWMFCEGLYLHTLLVVAFVSENRILKWFYLLGWGFPGILTLIYATARGCDPKRSEFCWMDDTPYNLILNVPVVISLVTNLFFLINIVRVLLTKLRASNINPDNQSTKKAARATLILIPLLGLHFILLPFRPPAEAPGHHEYNMISAVASSFQGFAVSLLFCFFNGEVLAIFKKKYNQHKLMRAPTSYNHATSISYMKSSVAEAVTFTTNQSDTHYSSDDV